VSTLLNFSNLLGRGEKDLSCFSALLEAGRDALSALASASRSQDNGSLRAYKQKAAQGASSFDGVIPKEPKASLPQERLHSFPLNNLT